MTESITRRSKAMLVLGGLLLGVCMTLLLGSPPTAKAGVGTYCNPAKEPAWETCWSGGPRGAYELYGWGDEHIVCIRAYSLPEQACSSGPGQGVYDPLRETVYSYLLIENHAPGAGWVHGVVYEP